MKPRTNQELLDALISCERNIQRRNISKQPIDSTVTITYDYFYNEVLKRMKENCIPQSVINAVDEKENLYSLGWYLSWNKNDKYATLDGEFEAKELHAIADHMETHHV